jgi:hypothetical protein
MYTPKKVNWIVKFTRNRKKNYDALMGQNCAYFYRFVKLHSLTNPIAYTFCRELTK